ncbi:hypothetical protein MA16_Dca018728 [Dendrobium catenatum]|uniref:DNA-directed RNA polymerase subunit n=1 Tax=Dendrobium catenatum TaxID=906689 RepID=A0A2I0W4R2_9ASPA|nr:hypothetical protein MA16_Dca018728 [Dendrobium catenatum]
MEGLMVSDANLTVYIHPSMANKIRGAILSQLSSLLFKYDEMFEGVLLAYQVDGRSRSARILPGLVPHIGVKLRASLLLFSPKPNMFIEGKVVKLGRESVHATVLGFSSAAIMLEDIRAEFKYKTRDGVGTFTSRYNKHHLIKVGSIIRFIVKRREEWTVGEVAGKVAGRSREGGRWVDSKGAAAIELGEYFVDEERRKEKNKNIRER